MPEIPKTPEQQEIEHLRERVEELEAENRELRELATIDSLTGLKNRRGFEEAAEGFFEMLADEGSAWEQRRERAHIEDLSVIVIDLDGLKEINDTYGHPAGDEALKALALAMGRVFREHDVLGRTGGDEFAVALPGAEEESAEKRARELGEILAEIKIENFPDVKVSASIGWASTKASRAKSIEELLDVADQAMYVVKKSRKER